VTKVLTEEEIKALTTPHERTLWGQTHVVTPALVEEVFGDGEKLLILTPIMTRPNYYVVQIDSSWGKDNTYSEEEGETVHDHIDEIYDAIEAQFGSADEEDDEELRQFPTLVSGGSTWCELSLVVVMREYRESLTTYGRLAPVCFSKGIQP
jgi:hypothetical protein